MKICITSEGNRLDSQVDPRFGRCMYFIVLKTDTMEFDVIDNSNAQAMGGAGVQAGKVIIETGAEAVLTGNVGPNAYRTLQAGGVEIITGVSGMVKEAVEKFKNGELKPAESPNVESHFGMNSGENIDARKQ